MARSMVSRSNLLLMALSTERREEAGRPLRRNTIQPKISGGSIWTSPTKVKLFPLDRIGLMWVLIIMTRPSGVIGPPSTASISMQFSPFLRSPVLPTVRVSLRFMLRSRNLLITDNLKHQDQSRPGRPSRQDSNALQQSIRSKPSRNGCWGIMRRTWLVTLGTSKLLGTAIRFQSLSGHCPVKPPIALTNLSCPFSHRGTRAPWKSDEEVLRTLPWVWHWCLTQATLYKPQKKGCSIRLLECMVIYICWSHVPSPPSQARNKFSS